MIEVAVPQGQMATVPLTLSNTTAEPVRVALALAPSPADLPGDGTEPGDVLFVSDDFSNLIVLAALPDGDLLVSSSARKFVELTPELAFRREFEHYESDFLAFTVGLTYNADARSALSANPGEGTLWWLDLQTDTQEIEQAILIEGTLGDPTADPDDDAWDSQPTGRELPVAFSPGPACGDPNGRPAMLAYDAVSTPELTGGRGLFYWLDIQHDEVWAMDTLGVVEEGYPVAFTDYKRLPWGDPEGDPNPNECLLGFGLDAHALSSEAGYGSDPSVLGSPVFEVMVGFQQELPFNRASRAVVTDRQGRSRGAETPLDGLPPAPDGTVLLELLDIARSRVDPSVLYVIGASGPVGSSVQEIVYGVRAAPLPPRWLHAERVLWELNPMGEAEGEQVAGIRLETDGLAVGTYEGVVSVHEGDGIGEVVVEVPVMLEVTESTAAGDPPSENGAARLSVYPNPFARSATVALSLETAAEVRVAVYDVLGREVATLHEGLLTAGTHRLRLSGARLPAGVYLVRVEAEGLRFAERITLLR